MSSENSEVILVIGNGMVGQRFLEKMKAYDTTKKYTLVSIGEEPLRHYNRMQLTEYFEHLSIDKLKLAAPEWYDEQGVALRLGSRVVSINPEAKEVVGMVTDEMWNECREIADLPEACREFTVRYDHLVIATGASAAVPRLPGTKLKGVFVYRTIQDLNDMIAFSEAQVARETADPKQKKYALVIGGGLLGLEAAKALDDMQVSVRIVNRGSRLMSRQLDNAGAKILHDTIVQKFGVDVLYHKSTKEIRAGGKNNEYVSGVEYADGEICDDVFMVVFATGIKPRDELASTCGMSVYERGGIVVDDSLETSVKGVYAIGECVAHREVSYGLVAPGYEMADIVAKNLTMSEGDEIAQFTGTDLSTKLKLMGTEVASFGDYFMERTAEPFEELVYNNPLELTYKKLIFSKDGKKLLGGIMVGDASDFPQLTLMYKQREEKPLTKDPSEILLGKRGGADEGSVLDLPDEMQVCSCNDVTKGQLCSAIKEKGLKTVGDIKKQCNAGTACGGCVPLVQDILAATLAASGQVMDKSLCEHFAYSRQELYQIILVEQYKTFADVLAGHGRKSSEASSQRGCEICKPTVASIFASQKNHHVLQGDRAPLQDSNDRFLANTQKNGQFSVVPRIAGGEITPDKLMAIASVAKKYGLYTKITGGQRVDLFGAEKYDLPAIWKELVEAGFESGHAYGKSLRTVKSCVGTTWCRYGQQDSVGFAIFLENRYKGIRSPHKIKGGVSGCTRECAEARGKDFGLIATEKGYNVYVCGNGGTNPKHAVLLATDVSEELAVKYLDRFMIYYIITADRLQRTSKWLEALEGGIEQLKRVVIDDSLGICASLEEQMSYLVDTYECEWKKVVETPELAAQFAQFRNTSETQDEHIMVSEREQKFPAPNKNSKKKGSKKMLSPTAASSPTSPSSPGAFPSFEDEKRDWVSFGSKDLFAANSGGAILYGQSQLAVFNVTETLNGIQKESWYATQNMCPHDNAFVLSQGVIGDLKGKPKVACPMHKKNFALDDGECLTGEELKLETFEVKEENGQIYVKLPPTAVLDERLATAKFMHGCSTNDCGDKTLDW